MNVMAMNVMKGILALVLLLALTRYVPVYYNSSEYNEFVKHETARARSESLLRERLLSQAREYSLPIQASDINVDESEDILRVTIDYTVPVNLLLVNPHLKFRATGSGLLPR
jgi:hypothetical protein